MADQFNWDVVVRLVMQGGPEGKKVLDDLTRSTDLTQKGTEGLSKSLVRVERDLGKVGTSAGTARKAMDQLTSPALRYALYDVSNTARNLSLAIAGIGTAAIVASAHLERAFADVERTLEPGTYSVEALRGELLQLSREIPTSFADISKVATLGNQLGIAADQISGFTETVVAFSTASGMSVDQVALAFGQLGNLLDVPADKFDSLASAIALVGVRSAATETQIVSIAREIAPAAASAGFAYEEVVGLSGALGSLKVPPERSRSTILQFFETLNMAVAKGGDDLKNFAKVVGVSSAELERMVRSGEGRGILERFIGRVSNADSVSITKALNELGLAGLRVNPTIRALARNMDGLQQSFADAEEGAEGASEHLRQLDIIAQTLSGKWQIFQNALMEFAGAVGNQLAPAAAKFLDVASGILHWMTEFVNSPIGGFAVNFAASIGGIVFALSALVAIVAGSIAALVGLRYAVANIPIQWATRGMAGYATSLLGIVPAAGSATAATWRLRTALMALGRATLVIGALQLAVELIFNFAGAMDAARQPLHFFVDALGWVAKAMVDVQNVFHQVLSNIPLIGGLFSAQADAFGQLAAGMGNAVGNTHSVLDQWIDSLQKTSKQVGTIGSQIDWDAWKDGFSGFDEDDDGPGKAVAGLAKKVRTLVDYANDLQSVFSRAFDIRFSSGSTLDNITRAFLDIREASEEAARNVARLKAEVQGLESDLSIQQYFLSIATEYGDLQRAEAIQANIAKLQADLADKSAELSKAQDANSKTLVGNSKAALDNRKTMEDLVRKYQDHLTALASSGLSQSELLKRTAALRKEFVQQATQLGFNATEVEKYARAFDDMGLAIAGVPRNITVTADTNPAIQALREYEAALNSARANAGKGVNLGKGTTKAARAAALMAELTQLQMTLQYMHSARENVPAAKKIAARIKAISNLLNSGNYAEGGYTGRGGKYEPAGIVHKGEYVVPKHQVNQRTGLPYADALGKLQRGSAGPGYQSGGYVRSGSRDSLLGQIESFGPMAFQQLHQALQQVVRLDGRTIADNSARNYADQTAIGAA